MNENINLTDIQKKILKFIEDKTAETGYPPTVREICSAVGLKSTSSVHAHLETLERKGYIKRDLSKPRAIQICDYINKLRTNNIVSVPIIGKVTAGQPILAVENIEEYFPLPKSFFRDLDEHVNNYFMLKVNGESMINAGIYDNDYIIVRCQQTAKNGDIVVALLEDEATVKRFYKKDDHIILRPENPYMEDIIVNEVKILGKVVGIFRKI